MAEAVDILQIPAFLCRQTDLLLAAGETGAAINVKKGQFLAPWDMENVAAKIASTGNTRILLCERGASFGYNMLVSDMRACRSWRRPAIRWSSTPPIRCSCRAGRAPPRAVSASSSRHWPAPPWPWAVAAVFIETHEDPDNAPSDGPNMVPIDQLQSLLATLRALDGVVKG